MLNKDINKYEDIIRLPHPTSKKHPRMSITDRAAQFSPFAALTGHSDAVVETARLTEAEVILSEDKRNDILHKLNAIAENIDKQVKVTLTYFVPDERKEGGAYTTITGIVKKIDDFINVIILIDKTEIPLDCILDIKSELFIEEGEV